MDKVTTSHATEWGHSPTFAGVAQADIHNLGQHDIVILGSPIDWGATHRPGARFGPSAIRAGDYLELNAKRPHLTTGIDPLAEFDVVDVGDLILGPGYLEGGLELNRQAVEMIASTGAVPIVLGGDHSITFANATAVANIHGHGNVALVHFDAHADTGETHFGHLYGHGTPMRRLIESGAIPGNRFAQIGLRGYWPGPKTVEWMGEQGMRWWFTTEITERGLDVVVDEAVAHVTDGADAVFLSIDVDVVDPGHGPWHRDSGARRHDLAPAARHGATSVPGAEHRRSRYRRSVASLRRTRRDHRPARQPPRPRDPQRNGGTLSRFCTLSHQLPATSKSVPPDADRRTDLLLAGSGKRVAELAQRANTPFLLCREL